MTVVEGTNQLVTVADLEGMVSEILAGRGKWGRVPELWDGKAAERIVMVLEEIAHNSNESATLEVYTPPED